MIIFWFYAGLLCAVALAFVLVPQLRRGPRRIDASRTHLNVRLYHERLHELETQHEAGTLGARALEAARVEAARDLLDDAQDRGYAGGAALGRTIPMAAALCMPLLALMLYLHWGSLDRLMLARQDGGAAAQRIEQTTSRLEALLATRPDSAEGWALLGRAYMAQERTAEAVHAFEQAATLAGRPAELLGRWAQAVYFSGGRQWTPQLQALIDEALASNPLEATSLRVAGMVAFQAGRYAEAAAYWERLSASVPQTDPSRAVIAADIARARDLAGPAAEKEAPR